MLNLKDFFIKFRKYKNGYWAPTSGAFYKILKRFINKKYKILECGSSTGHISYRLAKEGYDVTLLDIRQKSIGIAKKNFSKDKIRAKFICSDIFEHNNKYDFVWSSGLIQCYNDKRKEELIKKIASISNRMLLFYPDIENPNKKKGMNKCITPGVGDAKEYEIDHIPEITYIYFSEIYQGVLEGKIIGLNYNMYWLYAIK